MRADTPHTFRSAIAKLACRIAPFAVALQVLAGGAASASAASCPQVGSFSGGNQPPVCWRAYNDNSPFNAQIPAGANLATDSAAIVGQMTSSGYHFDGTQSSFQFDSDGSRPIYWASSSDPLVTIHCNAYWGPNTCQGANGVLVDGLQIHIPAGARPGDSWDERMIVVDQSTGTEYDFERASWTDPTDLAVWSASAIPIAGTDATGLGAQADAANIGMMAGVIRPDELAAGVINHALAISVPCTSGYVWPATGPWGLDCKTIGQDPASAPPMGGLLQLNMTPAQIAASGAPAWQQTIMTAMATYGMYINDTNGGTDNTTLEIEKQGDQTTTSFGLAPQMGNLVRAVGGTSAGPGAWIVGGVPIDASKLRLIAPIQCVAQGTCPAADPPVATPASATPALEPKAHTAVVVHRTTHRRKHHARSRHHKRQHHRRHHHRRRHHRRHHHRHLS